MEKIIKWVWIRKQAWPFIFSKSLLILGEINYISKSEKNSYHKFKKIRTLFEKQSKLKKNLHDNDIFQISMINIVIDRLYKSDKIKDERKEKLNKIF